MVRKAQPQPVDPHESPLVSYERPDDGELEILPFRHPWDRQQGEEAEDFALFRRYRDMGSVRGIDRLCTLTGLKEDFLRGLSMRMHWEARAFAYDQWIEGILSSFFGKKLDAETRETSQLILEIINRDTRVLRQLVDLESIVDTSPKQIISRLLALTNVFKMLHKAGIFDADNDKNRQVQINFVTGVPENVSIHAREMEPGHEIERLGNRKPRTGIEMAISEIAEEAEKEIEEVIGNDEERMG